MNNRIFAVFVVFSVVMIQTVCVIIQASADTEMAKILVVGCVIADVLSILTWFTWGENE